ncbi:hypothetical protein DRN84_02775 [Candidatus Geothermarchaeota archaeon]|nr:MAG: hypothetical protein DRN84_02775 [Candidatus Geothermarchaeota archaeon]
MRMHIFGMSIGKIIVLLIIGILVGCILGYGICQVQLLELKEKYWRVSAEYNSTRILYEGLKDKYDLLQRTYNFLNTSYTRLNASYTGLSQKHEKLVTSINLTLDEIILRGKLMDDLMELTIVATLNPEKLHRMQNLILQIDEDIKGVDDEDLSKLWEFTKQAFAENKTRAGLECLFRMISLNQHKTYELYESLSQILKEED